MKTTTLIKKSTLNTKPELSFCLPVYNVSCYLEKCFNSIFSINNVSYEIVCVDDCSTDDSYKKLRNIAKKYTNITLIHNIQNKGVSFSRNIAMNTATGKYIWFIDPDDMIVPKIVRFFLDTAAAQKADAVLGNFKRVNESDDYFDYPNESIPYEKTDSEEFILPNDGNTYMNSVCTGLYRLAFLLENNLMFNEKLSMQEDTVFIYEFSIKCPVICKFESISYLYRQHKSSAMHRHTEEKYYKYYLSMIEMLSVYLQHYQTKDFISRKIIKDKILHSKQDVALSLAMLSDTSYVRQQLKELKKRKYYPYRFRWKTLTTHESLARRLMFFLLPIRLFFWIDHLIFKKIHKKNNI